MAVVYISHRLAEVFVLADRVAVLRDGELVALRPKEALDEAEVVRLMVGRDLGGLFRRRTAPAGEPVLEVEDLSTDKVKNCSIVVRAGEVVGLGGLIGAGRSELARGIFGFDRRRRGTVSVAGRAVRPDSPGDAILAGIGFAPEDRKEEALLLARSVLDNITLCVPDRIGRFGLVDRGRAQAIAGAIADRLRIRTPSLDHSVAKLSGGNQQKVVLGRWLARGPKVLILDEPTRGIDVGAKAEIYRLIDELAAAGMAILLISSELPELLGLADRIIVMRAGRHRRRAFARCGERGGDPRAGDAGRRDVGIGDGGMSSPARPLAQDERTGEPGGRQLSLPGRLVAAIGTHNLSLLIALVVLVLIFGGLRPHIFFLPRNLLNIGLAIAILGVLAMSQTVVIVSGGLDISVGAIVGLATVSTALAIQATGSPAAGVLAGIVVGGLAGLVNGTIITMGPVNAVIATLGTMAVFRGIAFIISDGQSISIFNDGFRVIGAGTVLGLPVPILILLVTAALFHVFLAKTIIGRNIYAIGGNPVVARFAGLGLTRYRIGIYIMSGAAAGLGGILLAARTGSGQPISGSEGLELQAITAAVLGGCALQGGKGTIAGGLLGVIILGVLNNGMILTSVPTFYQLLARGALLIAAVVIAERQLSWRGE